MIRTPYTTLEHVQRKLPGSQIVFVGGLPRLRLATGEILDAAQAAEKAGINFKPYTWHEVNPGGAIAHD